MSENTIQYADEFDGTSFGNDAFGIEQKNDHHDSSELRTHSGIEFLDNIEDKIEKAVERVIGRHPDHVRFAGVEAQPRSIWTRAAKPDGIRVRTYALQANAPIQIADKATNRYRITVTLQSANPVSLAETTNGLIPGAPHSIAIGGANLTRVIEAKCDLWAVSTLANVIDVMEEFFTNQSL